MAPLEQIDDWPVAKSAAGRIDLAGRVVLHGEIDRTFRLASVSKLLTAWATLVAVEEGSVDLDAPAAANGATVRQLLAHAAGYTFDGPDPVGTPGRTRMYSNTGFEILAAHVAERTGLPFDAYVREAVTDPLGMDSFDPGGSPAKDFRCNARDLLRFAGELLDPQLLAAGTAREARSVQFPELAGLLPGIGRFSPNPWGLGMEIRGLKQPHWTGTLNSPDTFGHFGGSGTFLWVDPAEGLACLALANREFDDWAMTHWPTLSDAVITEHRLSKPEK